MFADWFTYSICDEFCVCMPVCKVLYEFIIAFKLLTFGMFPSHCLLALDFYWPASHCCLWGIWCVHCGQGIELKFSPSCSVLCVSQLWILAYDNCIEAIKKISLPFSVWEFVCSSTPLITTVPLQQLNKAWWHAAGVFCTFIKYMEINKKKSLLLDGGFHFFLFNLVGVQLDQWVKAHTII